MSQPVRIGIVGLGFGAEFIPIYQRHPDSELIGICKRDARSLEDIGDAFGVDRRFTRFDDMLADPSIDAVHINTPIPDHAQMSIAALRAGKHVACTVPMATTIDECRQVVQAVRESGRNYMMMETAVYTREFLFVRELYSSGALGRLQFLRGSHQQEMAGWPGYWEGLPPMHYATHAIAPLLALADASADAVMCIGSGRISDELASKYGSPFAVESALVSFADSPVRGEITRSLFETAREYIESFAAYGSIASFEWGQTSAEDPVVYTGEKPARVTVPDYAHLLPEPVQRFTTHGVYDEQHGHLSFVQGSGHGGSHPHLVHEFIRSIIEERRPAIDELRSANWTSVGLCAHESALKSGERVVLPTFDS